MARVRPADGTGEVADQLRARRNGALTPLDDILLHSPPLAIGWNSLLGAVRTRLTLPDDLRELVILRVAALNGAEYEWRAHEPLARQAGLSEGEIAALRDDGQASAAASVSPPVLSPVRQACLAYTDAMTRAVAVPDALFVAVLDHLGERQTVELTATVGAYNLVSRFLLALGISEDSEGAEAEATRDGDPA